MLLDALNHGHSTLPRIKAYFAQRGVSLSRDYTDAQLSNKLSEMKKWSEDKKREVAAKKVVADAAAVKTELRAAKNEKRAQEHDAELEDVFQGSAVSWDEDDEEEYRPAPRPFRSPPPQNIPAPKKVSPPRPIIVAEDMATPATLTRENSFDHLPLPLRRFNSGVTDIMPNTPESRALVHPAPELFPVDVPTMFNFVWDHAELRSSLLIFGIPPTATVSMAYDVDNIDKKTFELRIRYFPNDIAERLLPGLTVTIPYISSDLTMYWPRQVVPGKPKLTRKGDGVIILRFENSITAPSPLNSKHVIPL